MGKKTVKNATDEKFQRKNKNSRNQTALVRYFHFSKGSKSIKGSGKTYRASEGPNKEPVDSENE